MFLVSVPLAAQLVMLVADRPPVFKVEPTCRAVAARSATRVPAEACIRSENEAKTQLEKDWSQFVAADRSRCLGLSSLGGAPNSYVELLTCLEISQAARKLPDEGPLSTSGRTHLGERKR